MKLSFLVTFLMMFGMFHHTCQALMSVRNVSVERAKELGIELRAKPGGPNHAWIELEFKPQGLFSDFSHVSIEVFDHNDLELGWTPLKDVRTQRGTVIVRVMGSRAFLEKVTLRIVHGNFDHFGEDIHIKHFVDFEKLDQFDSQSKKESGGASGSALPAAAVKEEVE